MEGREYLGLLVGVEISEFNLTKPEGLKCPAFLYQRQTTLFFIKFSPTRIHIPILHLIQVCCKHKTCLWYKGIAIKHFIVSRLGHRGQVYKSK